MKVFRCLVPLAAVAICACASTTTRDVLANFHTEHTPDEIHHLMLSSKKLCPVPVKHLPEMIGLWEKAAMEKCGPKAMVVVKAPVTMLVVSSQLCPFAYHSSEYFTDVSGSFSCR